MSLPIVNGKGFLLSDGIELAFSKTGLAWARLPLSFRNSRKGDDGQWTHDREVKVDATVFGPLAEYLNENVSGRQEIWVSGELYTETFTTKTGEEKLAVRMNVQAAAPFGKGPRVTAGASRAAVNDDSDVPF